jgi:hypothetical protein
MKIEKNTIPPRMLEFAAGIINLTAVLEKTYTGRHVCG